MSHSEACCTDDSGLCLVVQVTHQMFGRAVEEELDRILAFFRRKHEELQQRLQALLSQLAGPHPPPSFPACPVPCALV